jgi:hypothetical protein
VELTAPRETGDVGMEHCDESAHEDRSRANSSVGAHFLRANNEVVPHESTGIFDGRGQCGGGPCGGGRCEGSSRRRRTSQHNAQWHHQCESRGNERHLQTYSRRLVRVRQSPYGEIPWGLREVVAAAQRDGVPATTFRDPQGIPKYMVGEAVEVKYGNAAHVNAKWYPGVVTKVQRIAAGTRRPTDGGCGFSYEVRYNWKKLIRSEVTDLQRIRECKDFDWCKGIVLQSLRVGEEVEARWEHKQGSKIWHRGKVTAECKDGTYSVTYHECETTETNVRRENIRNAHDIRSLQLPSERASVSASFAPCLARCGPEKGTGLGAAPDVHATASDSSGDGHWERTDSGKRRVWVSDGGGEGLGVRLDLDLAAHEIQSQGPSIQHQMRVCIQREIDRGRGARQVPMRGLSMHRDDELLGGIVVGDDNTGSCEDDAGVVQRGSGREGGREEGEQETEFERLPQDTDMRVVTVGGESFISG